MLIFGVFGVGFRPGAAQGGAEPHLGFSALPLLLKPRRSRAGSRLRHMLGVSPESPGSVLVLQLGE